MSIVGNEPVSTPCQETNLLNEAALLRYSPKELADLFSKLPDVHHIEGLFKGQVYGVVGSGILPRWLNALWNRFLQVPVPLWIGKFFAEKFGANLWFSRHRPSRFGYYEVRPAGDGKPMQLDYQVAHNPRVLHPVMGEVKTMGRDRYLARMLYRRRKGTVCVLYFTLHALEQA